jgi:hypothetical protein
LSLFKQDSLYALARKYSDAPKHYYVSASAPKPDAKFFSATEVPHRPHEALERLEGCRYRILLKRMELFDPDFADLLHQLFGQVVQQLGGLGGARVMRLESAIFVSSASNITPFHYDPEVNFFSQIEGPKTYHVYAPAAVSETELESFYARGVIDIAQLDLDSRDRSFEHTFTLAPGKGLHQPQNAPHWVETSTSRSVSYVFVFETTATRAMGRVRAFNHYMRTVGLRPAAPGRLAGADAVKSAAMNVVLPAKAAAMNMMLPARRQLGRAYRAVVAGAAR